MHGLHLSERYFRELAWPGLAARCPDLAGRIAAGLVGEGSECLGFDDDLSRDHDWGPAFCLWLTGEDLREHGARLRAGLAGLPRTFEGVSARVEAMEAGERVGLFAIGPFYRRFTGLERPPETSREWLAIPEHALAACTSGKVFRDPLGAFTAFRARLAAHYPEPVRLRKLAARCELLAQSGQYNLPRCLARNELVAARLAEAEFIRHAVATAHLLARRYCPFYKWMHQSLLALPEPGRSLHGLLEALAGLPDPSGGPRMAVVEEICGLLAGELRRQGLSRATDGFLLAHARELERQLDPELQSLDPRVLP